MDGTGSVAVFQYATSGMGHNCGVFLGGRGRGNITQWEQVVDRRASGSPSVGSPVPTPAAAAAGHVAGPRTPAVSLQGLSHPLLLADYKAKRQKLEHQVQMSSAMSAAAGSSKKGQGRLLGTRKEVMAR